MMVRMFLVNELIPLVLLEVLKVLPLQVVLLVISLCLKPNQLLLLVLPNSVMDPIWPLETSLSIPLLLLLMMMILIVLLLLSDHGTSTGPSLLEPLLMHSSPCQTPGLLLEEEVDSEPVLPTNSLSKDLPKSKPQLILNSSLP